MLHSEQGSSLDGLRILHAERETPVRRSTGSTGRFALGGRADGIRADVPEAPLIAASRAAVWPRKTPGEVAHMSTVVDVVERRIVADTRGYGDARPRRDVQRRACVPVEPTSSWPAP